MQHELPFLTTPRSARTAPRAFSAVSSPRAVGSPRSAHKFAPHAADGGRRAAVLEVRHRLDAALRVSGGAHEEYLAWDAALGSVVAQVAAHSSERGALLSGARRFFGAYVKALERDLSEQRYAAIDARLAQSERERIMLEEELSACEQRLQDAVTRRKAETKQTAVKSRWKRATAAADAFAATVDAAVATDGGAARARGAAGFVLSSGRAAEGKAAQLVAQLLELPNAKPVALCESLLASSSLEAKLELSRRLQKMMTPSEVREALTDLIERLKGDELVALLAGAFGELQPRERHALLQGALKALGGDEMKQFLNTLQVVWGARAVDNTAALYLAVPEARRLLVLETLLPSLGEDELAYLGLGRRLRHASSQCTPDSLDEELDAAGHGRPPPAQIAAFSSFASHTRRSSVLANRRTSTEAAGADAPVDNDTAAVRLQRAARRRSLARVGTARTRLIDHTEARSLSAPRLGEWAPHVAAAAARGHRPELLPASTVYAAIATIYEAKMLSDSACDKHGRPRASLPQIAIHALQRQVSGAPPAPPRPPSDPR